MFLGLFVVAGLDNIREAPRPDSATIRSENTRSFSFSLVCRIGKWVSLLFTVPGKILNQDEKGWASIRFGCLCSIDLGERDYV